MTDAYVPRRCQARYSQKMYLQCQGESSEATRHVEDHWAVDEGMILYWTELTAMYPAVDDKGCGCPPGGHTLTGTCLPDVPVPASERQVGGEHYRKFKIQPWDVIDEYDLSFYAGSVLKYLLRAGNKGPALEDLKKARHYLDKLIEVEEARDGE